MADQFIPELLRDARKSAEQGYAVIERTHFAHLGQTLRRIKMLGRIGGAVALGFLSAGIAVFVVVIVLNAIFQYAPPL